MADPALPKTTISTTSSSGVSITQPSQDPVLVTSSGNITTTDLYALKDVVVPATVTNDGTLSGQNGVGAPGAGSSVFNFGTVTGTTADGVALQGGGTIINGSVIDKGATITASGNGSAVAIGGSGTVTNFGTIKSNHAGIVFTGSGTVANSGTITSGSGAPAIQFGSGKGTLVQAPGSTINGSIANFGPGDSIDLLGVHSTGAGINYSASTGGLTITATNGGPLAMLSFQNSSLGPGTFHTASDGHGGTLITHS
jgi:hypothetical protein